MTQIRNKTCANEPHRTKSILIGPVARIQVASGLLKLVLCLGLLTTKLPIVAAQSSDDAVDSLLIDYQKTDVFRRAVSAGVAAIRVKGEAPPFLDTRLTPPPVWIATAAMSGQGPVFVFPAAAAADMVELDLLLPTGEIWTFSKGSIRVYDDIATFSPAKWPDCIKPVSLASQAQILPGTAGITVSGIEQPGWEVLTKAHLIEPAPTDEAPLWFSTVARGDGTPLFNAQKQLLAISVRPGYGNSDRAYVLPATALRKTLLYHGTSEPERKSRNTVTPTP